MTIIQKPSKKIQKIGVIIVSVFALLVLTGFFLYKHFVTDQIMDGGGGMENPYVTEEPDGDGTLRIEVELTDGAEETVNLQKIKE